MVYSNKVRAAVDILTDRGYELHDVVYDRLVTLERNWDGNGFLSAQILADEYHRRYKKDLNHAVFVYRHTDDEKKQIQLQEKEEKRNQRRELKDAKK